LIFLLGSDPDGLLELSDEQKEAGVVWRRPSEVLASAKMLSSDLRPEDIAQRVVADCSLCASIVVSLLHSRSHNSSVRLLFLPHLPQSHFSL
jgi:calpain-7